MVEKIVKITYIYSSKGGDTLARKTETINKGWTSQNQIIKTYSGNVDKSTGKVEKWNKKQEDVIKGGKKFKFEYLGVMFGGQAIANTFGQMTQGAIEWLGISELFQTSLNLIALEGLTGVSEGIYNVIGGLYDLPSAAKKSLGELMLFGQGTGLVMNTVGQMILMLSSLAMAFPLARGPIATIIGDLLEKAGSALGMSDVKELKDIAGILQTVGAAGIVGGIATTAYDIGNVLFKLDDGSVTDATGVLGGLFKDRTLDFSFADNASTKIKGFFNQTIFGSTSLGDLLAIGGVLTISIVFSFYAIEVVKQISEATKEYKTYIDALKHGEKEALIAQEQSNIVWSEMVRKNPDLENNLLGKAVTLGLLQKEFYNKQLTQVAAENLKTELQGVFSTINSSVSNTTSNYTSAMNIMKTSTETNMNSIMSTVMKTAGYMSNIVLGPTGTLLGSVSTLIGNALNPSASPNLTGQLYTPQNTSEGDLQANINWALAQGYHLQSTSQSGGYYKAVMSKQYGGIIPGSPGQPVPIIAHGGERFLGSNSSGTGEITVSPTYNIYVNDRSEIEQMLRRNNENLVNEVKRLSFGG
jgi:hypothetical protein